MHRRKPFSVKQKKKQLQEKRKRKKERKDRCDDETENRRAETAAAAATAVRLDSQTSSGEEESEVKEDIRIHEQPRAKQKQHDPNRYRLHFEQQSAAEIAQRKREAREPIIHLPPECLEVCLEDVYQPGSVLDFPKRPLWDYSMTKRQVEEREEQMFSKYFKGIRDQYRPDQLSWFEKNLETWRQLWRVLEMSDVILLITDIRHPVLHFPPALYDYVVNDAKKKLVLILNKVDLVHRGLVIAWKLYFESKFPELHIVCFSSFPTGDPTVTSRATKGLLSKPKKRTGKASGGNAILAAIRDLHLDKGNLDEWEVKLAEGDPFEYRQQEEDAGGARKKDSLLTIGLVGHPNVGKSSVINGLIGKKVVSCSRTPGHTKHFQTIYLTPTVCLCDCPGLVFPSLVDKNLQILSGLFPVSQVQEPYSPVGYLAARIPLVEILGIRREEGDVSDPDRPMSAWEICFYWAEKRGYYTARAARPDAYRAANSLLRLTIEGRLCMAMRPPGYAKDTPAKDHVSVAEQLIDRDETESDESSSEDDVSEEEADEALTNRYALLGNAPSEMI
ncbi:guanine nucleotide-binding protein-like 1 [Oscarella lobularis]|uniref:guanine nucleotide-binding protein-like 1 n=1 Tax=Oscarella lobularis TaxID=121494 RepID=UPI00331321CD